MMNIRVGFGYDVHKLVADRDLWLGGIKIDYELGLLGHISSPLINSINLVRIPHPQKQCTK